MQGQAEQSASVTDACSVHGEMTIYRADELKQVLLGQLASGQALALDLSGVTELDGAGLQLLLWLDRAARTMSSRVRIVATSPAVDGVLELLWRGRSASPDASADLFAELQGARA